MEPKQQILLNHVGNSAYAKFRELVSLDKRSLALFRILLGCSCLFDIYDRLRDLEAHYSDAGVLSRHEVLANFHSDYWISAYMMAGTSFGVFLIFMVHAFCALMLLIGYRTNLFSFLTFFFVISLQDRNYIFLHGGDVLQRVVMFFALFLPLGDVISVDQALQKKEKRRPDNATKFQVFSVGSLAMIIQILSMYWIAHKLKTGDEWRVHYTSGWLALQLDFFLRPNPVITLLFAYPGLTKFFTWAVLHWQRVGCLFYFSPAYTGPCKAFAVLGFCAMHFTFAVSMRLGLFSWITHTAALSLLPGWVWDTLTKYLKTREKTDMTIYYVDHCYYSHTAVKIIKSFFLFSEVRISPLSKLNAFDAESNERQQEHYVMDSTKSTWFMIRDHKGEIRRNSQAFVAMLRNSYVLFPLGKLLSLKAMAPVTAIMDRVAIAVHHNPLNAFTFKDNESELHPKTFAVHDARDTLRVVFKVFIMVLRNIVAAIFLYAIITWNMGMFGDWSYFPNWVKPTFYWAHLDQSWGMFAPRPPSSHFWYNIDATLDDGRNVELFSNAGLFTWEPSEQTWQKPDPFYINFKNHRWFKFFENGVNSHPRNDVLRLNFGRWICRNYNARHSGEDRLYTFQLNYMSESYDGLKPFAPRVAQPKQLLWNHRCYDK